MTKGWYVIHTYSGHENKVKLALEKKVQNLNLGDKIFQVKIPTVEEHSVKDGKKGVKPKKIFTG
jgi:transcriptional antiterminator NusG